MLSRGWSEEYQGDLDRHPPLTREEEAALARAARDGARTEGERAAARDELARRNIRLVAYLARRYRRAGDPDEVIADGHLGLMRAVDAYDPEEGVPFASYATYWIKAAIRTGLARMAYPVALPPNFLGQLLSARRSVAALEAREGRRATPEEVAAASGLSAEQAAAMSAALARREPAGPSGEVPQAAPEREGPSELAGEADERRRALEILARMPERLAKILRSRLALGEPRRSLRELGLLMGLSRERVRHLERRGIVMAKALAGGASYEDAWAKAHRGGGEGD